MRASAAALTPVPPVGHQVGHPQAQRPDRPLVDDDGGLDAAVDEAAPQPPRQPVVPAHAVEGDDEAPLQAVARQVAVCLGRRSRSAGSGSSGTNGRPSRLIKSSIVRLHDLARSRQGHALKLPAAAGIVPRRLDRRTLTRRGRVCLISGVACRSLPAAAGRRCVGMRCRQGRCPERSHACGTAAAGMPPGHGQAENAFRSKPLLCR